MKKSPRPRSTNWAGNVEWTPEGVFSPRSAGELGQWLAAGGRGRPLGAGHSFAPVAATAGSSISTARLLGAELDPQDGSVWVGAGTQLASLGEYLHEHGRSLRVLGDTDRITVAGAVATGTHGSGLHAGGLSSQLLAVDFVTPEGRARSCSRESDPQLFDAVRLSLGCLGVLTRLRFGTTEARRLREQSDLVSVDRCLEELDAHVEGSRHFEFHWIPGEDVCLRKSLDPLDRPPRILAPEPDTWLRGFARSERVDWSHRLFASPREHRFVEQEYAVPYERGAACFRALRCLLRERQQAWPVQFRTVPPDTACLSPASRGPLAAISVHVGIDDPAPDRFADVERAFLEHAGTPHLGKVHALFGERLGERCHQWQRFTSLRAALDPRGQLLNAYLRRLFGAEEPPALGTKFR